MIGIGSNLASSALHTISNVQAPPPPPPPPPPPILGIAYVEAEGQSNITGFNSVDQLPAAARKVYSDVSWLNELSNAGNPSAVVGEEPYVLAALGETVGAVTGRYGEQTMGAAVSAGVGPSFGLVSEYDADTLWQDAARVLLTKASTPGQHIDEFLPLNSADVWKNKVYARRFLRDQLPGLSETLHYQCKLWWQGEANAVAPRAASDLQHPDITDYRTKFEQVYQFDVDQMGPQPPWFVIALADISDPYTDAMNAQLRGLCRYVVQSNGAIVDQANGGHDNRYFVDHNISNGADVHLQATQMGEVGSLVATALRSLHGTWGYDVSTPISTIDPVLIQFEATDVAGTTATFEFTASDNGTLYLAAVPAGTSAPTRGEVKAGTGGGIVLSQTIVVTGSTAPGSLLSTELTILPAGSDFDVYAVLRTDGRDSDVLTQTISVPVAAQPSWDTTFEPNNVTYSENDLLATNTANSAKYVRGTPVLSSGKQYFEIQEVGNLLTIGLGSPATPPAGGSTGTFRCGWVGSNLQYSGGSQSMGGTVANGDIIQFAVDLDAQVMWMRKNGSGNWNNQATADPTTGAGGVTISGLGSAILPLAGMGNGHSARIATTVFSYSAPSGFLPWGS
ncbi:MAG: hypothetical protein AB8B51_06295 [Sedimentitalea sp.]